jgi:hypothetical protein
MRSGEARTSTRVEVGGRSGRCAAGGGGTVAHREDTVAPRKARSRTPPPAAVPLCGDCSTDNCGPGTTCLLPDATQTSAVCARYCCTDADCGSGAMCLLNDGTGTPLFGPAATMLGVCVLMTAPAGGTTGNYACTVPMTAPSMGGCVTVMP